MASRNKQKCLFSAHLTAFCVSEKFSIFRLNTFQKLRSRLQCLVDILSLPLLMILYDATNTQAPIIV